MVCIIYKVCVVELFFCEKGFIKCLFYVNFIFFGKEYVVFNYIYVDFLGGIFDCVKELIKY